MKSEERGGARLIAMHALERLDDEVLLDVFEVDPCGREREAGSVGRARRARRMQAVEVVRLQHLALGQQDRAFDQIA